MAIRTLGPGSLTIGPTGSPKQWGGDITKCELAASTESEDDIPYLDGTNESGEDTTTWELTGSIAEDYSLESLQAYTLDNAGREEPFVWTPNNSGEVSLSGTVKIRPIGWGGDVKKKNTRDFAFPLVGQPTHAAKV